MSSSLLLPLLPGLLIVFSVKAGWRYLKLDYSTSAYRADLVLGGPYLGYSVHFSNQFQ